MSILPPVLLVYPFELYIDYYYYYHYYYYYFTFSNITCNLIYFLGALSSIADVYGIN